MTSPEGSSTGRHLSLGLLKDKLTSGADKLQEGLLKGKMSLEHKLGLGHQPNVIPSGTPDIKGEPRPIEIGWHPVAGFAGKSFEKSALGRLITARTGRCPDPSQHWSVIVGEYCHELWMDESLNIIYINEKLDRSEWKTFEVGHTRFNDEALRQAGEMTIFQMRQKHPGYNLISNNCQQYALALLDHVQLGQHIEFATSFAVYRAAVGPGTIEELFKDQANELPPPQQEANLERPPGHVVEHAQQVMDENTTQLDDHHNVF